MTLTLRLMVFVALLPACGGWSKRDTILELAAQGSFVADWRQTRAAVARADRDYRAGLRGDDLSMAEVNPIIGDHGQNISPDAYFLCTGLLHATVAAAIPRGKWRTAFQLLTIASQAKTIYENHQAFEGQWREDYQATLNRTSSEPFRAGP